MSRWLLVSLALLLVPGQPDAHKLNRKARVTIVTPADGATVQNPVQLVFETEKIALAPVGESPHRAGHAIVLIDAEPPDDLDEPVPMTKGYLHLVAGEDQARLTLSPGPHTLQVVVGDEEHTPWGERLFSEQIQIVVVEP